MHLSDCHKAKENYVSIFKPLNLREKLNFHFSVTEPMTGQQVLFFIVRFTFFTRKWLKGFYILSFSLKKQEILPKFASIGVHIVQIRLKMELLIFH